MTVPIKLFSWVGRGAKPTASGDPRVIWGFPLGFSTLNDYSYENVYSTHIVIIIHVLMTFFKSSIDLNSRKKPFMLTYWFLNASVVANGLFKSINPGGELMSGENHASAL